MASRTKSSASPVRELKETALQKHPATRTLKKPEEKNPKLAALPEAGTPDPAWGVNAAKAARIAAVPWP